MKSIFSKILITSFLVLLIGVGILTLGLNFMYKSYIEERNKDELIRLAEIISKTIEQELSNSLGIDELHTELVNIEKYSNIKVWIMFNKQYLLASDSSISSDYLLEELSENEINAVLDTKTPILRKSNFKMYEDNEYYTLIYPVKKHDKQNIILFLNKSLPYINKTTAEINQFSLLTILIILFYSAVIMFFFTKKITNEIQDLNIGVNAMAKGNLDVKLNIDRNDEIGELSRNLTAMGKSLNEIEISRRKFVSNVSHDLRSPMTSISGYINGILDGTIPQNRWMHYLGIVSDESKRMIKLINDTLDLSKIQSGKYEISKSNVDINALILGVVDSYEQRLEEKNINVELNFAKFCEAYCDEMLIIRVVGNLLDNAIKFVNESGIISIKTEIEKNKILVGIKNSGSFIPNDKLIYIWGRFTKLDDSRGKEKNSSGLGLSIVKEIILAHGEKIDAYSDIKKGTQFIFSLQAVNNEKSLKL